MRPGPGREEQGRLAREASSAPGTGARSVPRPPSLLSTLIPPSFSSFLPLHSLIHLLIHSFISHLTNIYWSLGKALHGKQTRYGLRPCGLGETHEMDVPFPPNTGRVWKTGTRRLRHLPVRQPTPAPFPGTVVPAWAPVTRGLSLISAQSRPGEVSHSEPLFPHL